MRTGCLGRRPGTSAVLAAVAAMAVAVTTGCAPPAKSHSAVPTSPPISPRPAAASTTTPASGAATATVLPPAAVAGPVDLVGSWVADTGDVIDFVRTTAGPYHGTVIAAADCAPGGAAIVVTSQGRGRFTGTGPFPSGRDGWCGPPSPLAPVTIQVGAGGSTAQVSGDATTAVEAWTRTTFVVSGHIAPPGPNNEDQAEGSPALAKTCDQTVFRRDELDGALIATSFGLGQAAAASELLRHFLGGSATPVGFPPGSAVAAEAARSDAFRQEDQRIRNYVAGRLDQGQTSIDLDQGQGLLGTIGFTDQSIPDLYLGFRGTQGLDVSGVGAVLGADYVGELTYVIRDAYGVGVHDYLLGAGPQMRYLQTTCGAPYYPGGAHWFPDSITITAPFRMPVKGRG